MRQFHLKTALVHLCGRPGTGRLEAMIGASQFGGKNPKVIEDETFVESLYFKFKGSRKANYCHIELTDADLYRIKFVKTGKKQGIPCVLSEHIEDEIYADQLQTTFERFTGLYVTL